MRILTWNVRRAAGSSKVWDYIREADPCISILQEVTQVPADIQLSHHIAFEPAVRKTGKPQSFGNAIISKMPLHEVDHLYSDVAWVNDVRSFFAGNLLMRNVTIANGRVLNLLNIYSPAWSVPTHLTEGLDLAGVKLVLNPQLYFTEIIWKVLADSIARTSGEWIVGGDFNSSETFDHMWGPKPRGNRELMDRMNAAGLHDALREKAGQLTPTFRSPRNGTVVHQMDHLYLTQNLMAEVEQCCVPNPSAIFANNLSDHLPITAEFNMKPNL